MNDLHTLADLFDRWQHGPQLAEARTPEGLRDVVAYLVETQGWPDVVLAMCAVASSQDTDTAVSCAAASAVPMVAALGRRLEHGTTPPTEAGA
jgi:class 3 adenylate cyclase